MPHMLCYVFKWQTLIKQHFTRVACKLSIYIWLMFNSGWIGTIQFVNYWTNFVYVSCIMNSCQYYFVAQTFDSPIYSISVSGIHTVTCNEILQLKWLPPLSNHKVENDQKLRRNLYPICLQLILTSPYCGNKWPIEAHETWKHVHWSENEVICRPREELTWRSIVIKFYDRNLYSSPPKILSHIYIVCYR